MENQQWPAKYEQSVATSLESTDDSLNNGNGENASDNTESTNNAGKDDSNNIKGSCETNLDKNSLNYHVSDNAKQMIQLILEKVRSLSQVEKFLLHLKLSEVSNGVDPLRQPLNPLGSRSEIHRTISWIKTHLKEDPDTSLPKQEVYDEYHLYCSQNNIKPLSQADFGKVMKQVYPKVRARRLGTRGNSRYCYSGLRRCLKLKAPILPDLADKPLSTEPPCTESSLTAAAWLIVKEWAEKKLGIPFISLQTLACYLIINHSIGVGTQAANQLMAATETHLKGEGITVGKCGNKHREMQLQLQRKIQQKHEVSKERKRKMQSPKCEQKNNNGKKSKQQQQNVIVPNLIETTSVLIGTIESNNNSNSTGTGGSTSTSPTQGKSICDKSLDFTQLPALPDFKSFQKPNCEQNNSPNNINNSGNTTPTTTAKVAIPRLSGSKSQQQQQQSPQLSPKKQAKNVKYKAIQPKLQPCDIASYNPQLIADHRSQDVHNINKFKERKNSDDDDGDNDNINNDDNNDCDVPVFSLPRERLNSISNVDKDAMDEYLGTNNSQHEEELSKYFSNNLNDTTESDNTTKLSQLRQLLEQNGISDNKTNVLNAINGSSVVQGSIRICNPVINQLQQSQSVIPYVPSITQSTLTNLPTNVNNHNNNNSHGKRRVSFETPIQDDNIPPSPNTRRKNFSFTPISPGPQSPSNNNNGGRQSKCSSTNVSPFVSPRNTPIPRTKNNTHQNAGIMLSTTTNNNSNNINTNRKQQQQQQQINCTKIKKENDLNLEITTNNDINFVNFNNETTYMPMSAPASPMLNNKSVLQKLLNSNSKVSYTPDYINSTTVQSDTSSNEISQFFQNETCQNITTSAATDLNNYRSQSVPLHQMVKSNFPINNQYVVSTLTSATAVVVAAAVATDQNTNDFNDLDPIPETESVTVNRIINALDEQQCGDNSNIEMYNMDLNPNNQCLPSFGLIINNNLDIQNDLTAYENQLPPSTRNLARSQSIDVNINCELNKYNPSRSVPNTPLPFTQRIINKSQTIKNFNNQYSRSHPSTPLLAQNETFNYTINSDCLLNGQPIRTTNNGLDRNNKELLTDNMNYFITNLSEINEDNNIDDRHLTQNDEYSIDRATLHGNEFDISGENDNSLVMDENGILIGEQNCNGNIN